MGRVLRGLVTFSLFAGPILAAQRATSTQEVRVSSWTYTPPAPTVQVQTKLVDVGVVVRNRQARAIAGLTKDDFKIYDEGKERAITAFSVVASKLALAAEPLIQREGSPAIADAIPTKDQEAAKPGRYLALVFDDVSMKNGDVMHVRVAAKRFVQDALQPEDWVAIFTTSNLKVLDFTADKGKLVEVIEKLSAHQRMSENGLMPCPRITPYQAYLITMQDPVALQAAVQQQLNCFGGPGGETDVMQTGGRDYLDAVRTVRVQSEQTWDQAKTISQGTLDAIADVVDRLAEMPGNRVLLLASSGFLAEMLEYQQNRIIDHAVHGQLLIPPDVLRN